MQVLYARCAGLDVHKKTVVVCVMLTLLSGQVSKQVRTFATTTAGLLALADWLSSQQVTHVAMESTGVYWRPVFNILEGSFQVILVNAQHRKAVPGHKTDVKDSEWIADAARGMGCVIRQFHPAQAHSRPARLGALSQELGARADPGRQPPPKGLGDGQYQVVVGG